MPNDRAVCKLITNSNFVDCKTGRSAGLGSGEYASGIDANLAKHVAEVSSVTHQHAGSDHLA